MLLNSTAKLLAKPPAPSPQSLPSAPPLKASFDRYKAYAIKLNLLSEAVADTPAEQADLDRIQTDCIKGQLEVLKSCGQQAITSVDEAKHMMALWQEDVIKSQSDSQLSDTDRMISQLFTFFQTQLDHA